MRSRETRPRVLDAYFEKRGKLVKRVLRYYRNKSSEELRFIKSALVHQQHTIGNIPLLASTTPFVLMIFGGHLGKVFPHDGIGWVIISAICILIIVWAINHHFQQKGRVYLDLHLIDEILKERSQNQSSSVK